MSFDVWFHTHNSQPHKRQAHMLVKVHRLGRGMRIPVCDMRDRRFPERCTPLSMRTSLPSWVNAEWGTSPRTHRCHAWGSRATRATTPQKHTPPEQVTSRGQTHPPKHLSMSRMSLSMDLGTPTTQQLTWHGGWAVCVAVCVPNTLEHKRLKSCFTE